MRQLNLNRARISPIKNDQIRAKAYLARIIEHLQIPLYRNGYALVVSSLSTSAFGMVFWILAARLYAPAVVGLDSAAISAMMFLAGLAQLNLNSAMIRFIRGANRSAKKLALLAYGISILVGLLAGSIFILFIRFWAPPLSYLGTNLNTSLWFVISTALWCIFVLQDGLLTGLQFATWVPLENTVYALTKITLLVVFVKYLPTLGVYNAWTVAVVASIIPTNFFLFKHLVPGFIRSVKNNSASFSTGQVVKFVAADYFGSLSWMACTYLLPVIVTAWISPEANAYYYLAWTIASTLFLITPNIGASLVVETALQPENLAKHLRAVFFQVARLVIPITFFIVIFAPIILRIFGKNYSAEGTLLLRLLALSAIPNIINSLFANVTRVQQRRKTLLITLVTSSALVLSFSFALIPVYGIVGVGIAFISAQTLLAIIILITQRKMLTQNMIISEKVAITKTAGELNKSRWPGYWVSSIFRRIALTARLKGYLEKQQKMQTVQSVLPDILNTIPRHVQKSYPATWEKIRPIATATDRQIFLLGTSFQKPTAILKLPLSTQSLQNSIWEMNFLRMMHEDIRLDGWDKYIPRKIVSGSINWQPYLVESYLPGVPASSLIDPANSNSVLKAMLRPVVELHQRTGVEKVISEKQLDHWITSQVKIVKNVLESYYGYPVYTNSIQRLVKRLSDSIVGAKVPVSFVHGDYAPGNILMSPDDGCVTGIIDWELADKEGLGWTDVYTLLVTTRMLVQRKEFGILVRDFINGDIWTNEEENHLSWAMESENSDRLDSHALLLISWLQHISNTLRKSISHQKRSLWITNNVEAVLSLM